MLEIDKQDLDSIWRCLAAILHLGNLEFEEKGADAKDNALCNIIEKGLSTVAKISELLSVSPFKLKDALLNKTIKVKRFHDLKNLFCVYYISHLLNV